MRASNNSLIKILSTGFIVLLLLSLSLFWFRWLFENDLIENALPQSSKEVVISPVGLIPDEIENDPNITDHSNVRAALRYPKVYSLGIVDNVISFDLNGRNLNVYWYRQDETSKDWSGIFFDKRTGQIVCRQKTPYIQKVVVLYAGPEGVSDIPDKKLGKFDSPIADGTGFNRDQFVLYDGKSRCFFRIEFNNNSIVRGPQLSKDDTHKPIQIGTSGKYSPSMIILEWNHPMYPKGLEERNERFRNVAWSREFPYLPVLDESGRIDLLDVAKLEFVGIAGYLPVPETLFPSQQNISAKDLDLLAYQVLPVAFETDNKNRGMFVASLNREGTAVTLSVFDANGLEIASNSTACEKYNWPDRNNNSQRSVSTSKAIYNEIPMGPVNAIIKFSLENLQSPILSLTSYFTADSFEAGSGHRALFILPNSFIAMKSRDSGEYFAARFVIGVIMILPSIFLSIYLAERIKKDSVVIGLSKNDRLFWVIGTLAFGLTAYITYRLTKPKITLVTCQNCGKPRRPDMDKCHRCSSLWHIPELTPLSWKVIN